MNIWKCLFYGDSSAVTFVYLCLVDEKRWTYYYMFLFSFLFLLCASSVLPMQGFEDLVWVYNTNFAGKIIFFTFENNVSTVTRLVSNLMKVSEITQHHSMSSR